MPPNWLVCLLGGVGVRGAGIVGRGGDFCAMSSMDSR